MDHADAMLRLGVHRDVELSARSMIEGLCQLKWAGQDPEARADRWLRFVWVQDWRLLQKKLRDGLEVSDEERRRIEAGVQKYCTDFKKNKVRPGADPFIRHWSGKSVAELCADVDGTPLYEWPYAGFSDWHHWSPGGVFGATQRQDKRVTWTQPQPGDVVPAYAVAFQCLYETVHVANSRFKLGLDAQLDVMYKGYLQDLALERTDSQ